MFRMRIQESIDIKLDGYLWIHYFCSIQSQKTNNRVIVSFDSHPNTYYI
jgi:hypothetical protein